jgi:hypothetical protein
MNKPKSTKEGKLSCDHPLLAEHAAEIRRLGKRVIADVIEIGRRLTDAKAQIEHGEWSLWLRKEFGWTDNTALNFMRCHELAKSANFADLTLPVSGLYLLAAPSTPAKARDEIIERAAGGEKVTTAQVKATIAKAKSGKPPAQRLSRKTKPTAAPSIAPPQTKTPAAPEPAAISEANTPKPATAASAEPANVTEVAEAPSSMAETANPITGTAVAGEALDDEPRQLGDLLRARDRTHKGESVSGSQDRSSKWRTDFTKLIAAAPSDSDRQWASMQVMASTEPGDPVARIAAIITEAGAPAVAEAALARLSADQKTELLNKTVAASPAQARTTFWQLPPSGPGGARPGHVFKPENSKQDIYGGVADREHAGVDDERGGVKQSAPPRVRQPPMKESKSVKETKPVVDDMVDETDDIDYTDEKIDYATESTTNAGSPVVSSLAMIVDRLRKRPTPAGVPPHCWRQFLTDSYRFLRSPKAVQATERGWSPRDLFAWPTGLLAAVDGGKVVEVHRDWAEIETASGRRRVVNRRTARAGNGAIHWAGTPME